WVRNWPVQGPGRERFPDTTFHLGRRRAKAGGDNTNAIVIEAEAPSRERGSQYGGAALAPGDVTPGELTWARPLPGRRGLFRVARTRAPRAKSACTPCAFCRSDV